MNGLDKIFKSLFSTDPPPGRDDAMEVENRHFVKETNIQEPVSKGARLAMFGMGCFWGAEAAVLAVGRGSQHCGRLRWR